MDNAKTRVRSKEELISREKGLIDIIDILEKNKIYYFLQAGVVLGARRDNYFIKWDWDVEIGIFEKDFMKNYNLIRDELLKKEFKIYHEIYGRDGKINVFRDFDEKSTIFELLSWKPNLFKTKYFRWHINIPAKFFKTNHTVNFLNRKFNCPGPVDDYLKYQYGEDWRVPKVSSDKKEYLTKDFFNKNFSTELWRKIIKKLNI